MKKIMIINGPNLNMLGIREKNLYGSRNYDALIRLIQDAAEERNVEADCRQSNHEGDLVDWIQEACFQDYEGIVINPGAYTHTSIALADAVKAIAPIPVVEVHITDISSREEFRHVSYEAPYCLAQIKGHGFAGYVEGMDLILQKAGEKKMTLLEESRREINEVDAELVKLFERRMQAVEGVIRCKMENNLPIFDSSREKDNIERNSAKLTRKELKPYFEKWYQMTMEISKEYQKSIAEKNQK